jgi:hypothetical protein
MSGEAAAELRQSVSHASLVAYGAVMPLVEKNMVLFNDLVALAFAERVLQVQTVLHTSISSAMNTDVFGDLLQDDSALASKWSITVPSAFTCTLLEDAHSIAIGSSGAHKNPFPSSAVSPPLESHPFERKSEESLERDAEVNRQVLRVRRSAHKVRHLTFCRWLLQ